MTDMITDAELAELKAGLEGVTPGPWWSAGGYLTTRNPNRDSFTSSIYHLDEMGQARSHTPFQAVPFSKETDAAHIARCSPDKIAALIARLEAAERLLDRIADPEKCDRIVYGACLISSCLKRAGWPAQKDVQDGACDVFAARDHLNAGRE